MSFRVSRRNGRTASSRKALAKEKALLAISALIFMGGIGDLAWTLDSQAHEPPAPTPRQLQSDGSDDAPSYGSIVSGQGGSSSSSSSASSASPAASQAVVPEPSSPSEAEAGPAASPGASASAPDDSPTLEAPQGAQPSRVVHHDAYRELPVYRVVHHQASTPREVVSGGSTRIEWTGCPVCGQRHDASYNERVVDHVNEALCSACGGRHASSYDEVLY